MKIYACGCSYTYGDELANPNESAWPVLLANKLQASIVNDSVNGGTNYRTVYQTIKNTKDNYDLYIIAWTNYSRLTFYKSDNHYETNFNPHLKHALYSSEKIYTEWGKTLYKHWYNDLYAFKLWLQQIMQLQKLLAGKNYIMINTAANSLSKWLAPKESFAESIESLVSLNTLTDEQIFDEYEEIQYYISLIDHSNFYKWSEFYIKELSNHFKNGPRGHILEEGHEYLANLMYEYVQNKISHS
jgi:hypothetical protein